MLYATLSNSLEILYEQLVLQLASEPSRFRRRMVAVPSRGVGEWLERKLAGIYTEAGMEKVLGSLRHIMGKDVQDITPKFRLSSRRWIPRLD